MKKMFFRLFIFSLLFAGSLAKANDLKTADHFKELVLELQKVESKDQGTDPSSPGLFKSSPPSGHKNAALPPDCDPREFQRQALESYQNSEQYAAMTTSYFKRCSRHLTKGNTLGLPGLLKFSNTSYKLADNPQIQFKVLTLSDGTKLEAYIGLKDDQIRRPWVLAKCGVFCDITSSSSTLNFIINYFDQSPFNFIFVSNHTGNNHIKNNAALTLGGFYEVYDLYDLAHWLKFRSPYRETVDSIHAAGISLGGSTAMAVSHLYNLYHAKNHPPHHQPLFSSTTAICPVVNLGPTLKDMYANTIKGKVFTQYTWKYLKDAAPYLTDAQDYLNLPHAPESHLFPSMLVDIVMRYGTKWEHSAPPGRETALPSTFDDFLTWNQFSNGHHPNQIPTFAWASRDDHVVNYELNTNTLIERHDSHPNEGAVGVDFGDHCAFATAYGFLTATSVFQTFILNNSPTFKARRHNVDIAFPVKALNLSPNEIHLRQWWQVLPDSEDAILNFETFSSQRGLPCRMADPFQSPSECRKSYKQTIPLSRLARFGAKRPTNSTMAEVLTRQLNYMVQVKNKGHVIDGTNESPSQLGWVEF